MSNMVTVGESRRLEYTMPTRAIFGLRGELLTLSRGTAVMSHTYYDHQPLAGEIPGRSNGALVRERNGHRDRHTRWSGSSSAGASSSSPAVDVYEGMVVGRANDDKDVAINVVRAKKLTNMRAAGSDENVRLPPADDLSLERAIEFIEDDELVEVTPKSIRIRKRLLNETDRLRAASAKSLRLARSTRARGEGKSAPGRPRAPAASPRREWRTVRVRPHSRRRRGSNRCSAPAPDTRTGSPARCRSRTL